MKVKIIIISFLLFTLLAGLKSQDIHENFSLLTDKKLI
jgi:hypothetical protein